MKKEDINIILLKKKNMFLKRSEIKKILLKSIIHNQKIPHIYKNYAMYMLSKKGVSFMKFKHLCLLNNKNSSVSNHFYLSRYPLKNLLTSGKAQNIKINSW